MSTRQQRIDAATPLVETKLNSSSMRGVCRAPSDLNTKRMSATDICTIHRASPPAGGEQVLQGCLRSCAPTTNLSSGYLPKCLPPIPIPGERSPAWASLRTPEWCGSRCLITLQGRAARMSDAQERVPILGSFGRPPRAVSTFPLGADLFVWFHFPKMTSSMLCVRVSVWHRGAL